MIETTITKIQYDADGVQRRWSIPFQYADAKHISIYTKVGDEPTVKVVDNYDIDEDDSVVIYPTIASGQEPVAAGTKIIIARETPETQLEDASQVHFTSKDVERGLDKLTMITQELSTTATETMEVSADAFEAAEEAVSTANEANAIAGEAKTLAEQAVSVANDANATATAANTKSDTTIKTANDANEKSTTAVSTANDAKTVADEANSTANKANATATEAKEIASAANTTANNADKTANEADKKADNAVIIATDAKSIAEGIDAKATQAISNSNTAINTANSAKQTAEGIDGKATQALANSTTALETATEAKNTADSYQGQITTIEEKIPSAASETNQLADKQFVQDLTSALNFVQWIDTLPETGESKYIYAVPREETDTDGKPIAALYLWDGTRWNGAGAFSLNIDPDTLATKTDLTNYLPLTGGKVSGKLIVSPSFELRRTDSKVALLIAASDINYVSGRTLGLASNMNIVRYSGTGYNNSVLWSADKSVANGVASLDANAKVPTEQIPVATASSLGGVKPDGDTITVTEDGVISVPVSSEVATKADLQDRVAKAGDTMTGNLNLNAGLIFGNYRDTAARIELPGVVEGKYYQIVNNASESEAYLQLYDDGAKGLVLIKSAGSQPHYFDGANAYRLLTTADLNSLQTQIDSLNTEVTKMLGRPNYNAGVSITLKTTSSGSGRTATYTVPSDGVIWVGEVSSNNVVYINNMSLGGGASDSVSKLIRTLIPVSAGDILKVSTSGTAGSFVGFFAPNL